MNAKTEVRISELTGKALDWAVALATGAEEVKTTEHGVSCIYQLPDGGCWTNLYQPSIDWGQGGFLIERYNIQLSFNGHGRGGFCAYVCSDQGIEERPSGGGKTHLLAAMRAIVAAKFIDTISVPAELI